MADCEAQLRQEEIAAVSRGGDPLAPKTEKEWATPARILVINSNRVPSIPGKVEVMKNHVLKICKIINNSPSLKIKRDEIVMRSDAATSNAKRAHCRSRRLLPPIHPSLKLAHPKQRHRSCMTAVMEVEGLRPGRIRRKEDKEGVDGEVPRMATPTPTPEGKGPKPLGIRKPLQITTVEWQIRLDYYNAALPPVTHQRCVRIKFGATTIQENSHAGEPRRRRNDSGAWTRCATAAFFLPLPPHLCLFPARANSTAATTSSPTRRFSRELRTSTGARLTVRTGLSDPATPNRASAALFCSKPQAQRLRIRSLRAVPHGETTLARTEWPDCGIIPRQVTINHF
ncbi:hypothetical protein B0H14DRAFT_2592063 [Mycena olivaceomarginata]|nr:hypothetical protein B0H14DRAFT_2592063 [Mycena olivaceomarginata]